MGKLYSDPSKPVEKRLSYVETVLSRMMKRTRKTITSIITPHLISTCIDGDSVEGDILKVMLFRGTITKGLVCFDKRYKDGVRLEAKILNGAEGVTETLYINTMAHSKDLNIPTEDGSLLSLSVAPVNLEDKIKKVYVSLLWTPHISNSVTKKHLIDSLDAVANNLIEE